MSTKTIASTREAAADAILEAALKDPKVVFVSADSVKAARATKFAAALPERLFEMGIAEQTAVAFAAGLASCGYKPFVMTYANFITMRACEQVRNYTGYTHLGVKLVGLNGGVHGGEREGVTHQSIEDLAILRAVPGMEIVVPADPGQTRKALFAMLDRPGPGYIRVGCGREPVLCADDEPFVFDKLHVMKKTGNDAVVFAVGPVLRNVLKAAERLEKEGIGITVVDLHTLKPLDSEGVKALIAAAKIVITVEDHNVIGGLGSAVAEVMAESGSAKRLTRLGLQDVFGVSGDGDALLDHFGMSADTIAETVKRGLAGLNG
ncbi:MAG: transketolase C-terminal domain-containing protein [Ancalomicrobiaceae bacterium]|nr:transketolase C-terminal domain-containing protein [Ancalomicrobiaceae bacterium]